MPESGPQGPPADPEQAHRARGQALFRKVALFRRKAAEKGVTWVFFRLPLPCEPVLRRVYDRFLEKTVING